MTTKQFKRIFKELGNSACGFKNGELVTIYNLTKKKSEDYVSYYLEFPQKNVAFIFTYDESTMLKAIVWFCDRNKPNVLSQLDIFFTTDSATELENELYKIIAKWRR